MWKTLTDKSLHRLIRLGALSVTFADGSTVLYGESDCPPVCCATAGPDMRHR